MKELAAKELSSIFDQSYLDARGLPTATTGNLVEIKKHSRSMAIGPEDIADSLGSQGSQESVSVVPDSPQRVSFPGEGSAQAAMKRETPLDEPNTQGITKRVKKMAAKELSSIFDQSSRQTLGCSRLPMGDPSITSTLDHVISCYLYLKLQSVKRAVAACVASPLYVATHFDNIWHPFSPANIVALCFPLSLHVHIYIYILYMDTYIHTRI